MKCADVTLSSTQSPMNVAQESNSIADRTIFLNVPRKNACLVLSLHSPTTNLNSTFLAHEGSADTVRELLPEILALLVTVEVLLNDLDLLADEVLLVEAELLEVPETLLLRLSVAELLLEKDCENEEKEKGAELEGVLDASAVKLELGEWELEGGVLEEAVEDLEGVTEPELDREMLTELEEVREGLEDREYEGVKELLLETDTVGVPDAELLADLLLLEELVMEIEEVGVSEAVIVLDGGEELLGEVDCGTILDSELDSEIEILDVAESDGERLIEREAEGENETETDFVAEREAVMDFVADVVTDIEREAVFEGELEEEKEREGVGVRVGVGVMVGVTDGVVVKLGARLVDEDLLFDMELVLDFEEEEENEIEEVDDLLRVGVLDVALVGDEVGVMELLNDVVGVEVLVIDIVLVWDLETEIEEESLAELVAVAVNVEFPGWDDTTEQYTIKIHNTNPTVVRCPVPCNILAT